MLSTAGGEPRRDLPAREAGLLDPTLPASAGARIGPPYPPAPTGKRNSAS